MTLTALTQALTSLTLTLTSLTMTLLPRRCGMITRREAERLCKSFLGDNSPPRLPDSFSFEIMHECAWGCRGQFMPARYNSSRAKCIKCSFCSIFFSPNK